MNAVPPIQIQVCSGPHAGTRLVFDHSPLTFGRGEDNTIVLDLPTASRRHGELRFENGRWLLVNTSPNGTRLDNKAVTAKPRILSEEAEIAIGNELVLHLWVGPIASGDADSAGTSVVMEAPRHAGLSGRHKVWIGIGVYLLGMLALFVFFGTLSGRDENDAATHIPELSIEVIRGEIRQPLPKHPPDARRAREAIEEARELFAMVDVEKDALYRAHEAYLRALSYTRGHTLDDAVDQRRFSVIQQQLTSGVIERYTRAYNMLRSRQYDAAAKGFQELLAYYPAQEGDVFENAQSQWEAARRAEGRRR